MKSHSFRPLRAAPMPWRIPSLTVLLLLAVGAGEASGENAAMPHQRVSPPGRASEIGYFNTSPESPDGSTIAYVAYDKAPGPESAGGSSGGLYLCDADLANHVRIRDIARISWHDGANQIWLDNDTLAYMDHPPEKAPVAYVIRRNGDLLLGPIEASLGHGHAPDGSVPLQVSKRQYPDGSSLGSSGLYLYKDGAVTKVVDLERDLGPLRDRLEGGDEPSEWSIFHAQLSANGAYLSIRLDTQKGSEYIVTCKSDGTDARLFHAQKKPLHQQWYDDSTLFAHERNFNPDDGGPRLRAKRWTRDGEYIETLAGVGNHPGISPDRRYLASETLYTLEPVVLSLYRTGSVEPVATIMSVPAGPIWKMRTHVNPAFSRDGTKVYFNKPVDGMPQVHRVDITSVMRAEN